ncbi:hypothetical protein KA005_12435 [bacterium]|nr:hypothetical protein [bacterium]
MIDKLGRELKVGQAIAYGHHGYAGLRLYEITGFTPQQVKCIELRWGKNYVDGKFTKEFFPFKFAVNIKLPSDALILEKSPAELMELLDPNER